MTEPTAAQQAIALREEKQMAMLEKMDTFDWKALAPPVMAQILTKVPFKGKDGVPEYLTLTEAMIFAIRCYELGLSPISGEVWFDKRTCKTNVTTEGKLKLARKNGFNFGPPKFTRVERQMNGRQDHGYTCSMSVNGSERAEYTAYLSEWMVAASPVWKTKPDHMLQLRAMEKCISFASGTGVSEMPSDKDIETASSKSPTELVTNTDVSEVNFAPMNGDMK
jgi:hypothetical protein